MEFFSRYLLGVGLCVIGVINTFLGTQKSNHFFYLIGSFCLGSGSVFMYLTSLGVLKHYPQTYLSSYLIGDYAGGFMMTVFYLVLKDFNIQFQYVSHPSRLIPDNIEHVRNLPALHRPLLHQALVLQKYLCKYSEPDASEVQILRRGQPIDKTPIDRR